MPLMETYSVASIISCQLSLLLGTAQGFSAILLPQLLDSKEDFHINSNQASWIASLGIICRPLGAFIEGMIINKFGRKVAMQILAFSFTLSWIFTALSNNIVLLCASRMFLSFTIGMVICVGLYIGEITPPEARGTYLSLITPMINCGILVVYLLGYFYCWKPVAYVLAAYSSFVFCCLKYVPESHIWYMLKNRKTAAVRALLKVRKNDADVVNAELEEIRKKLSLYGQGDSFTSFKNYASPTVWKPFLIFAVFSFFQQQAGYNIIMCYAITFFNNIGIESTQTSHILSITFALISIVGSAILVIVVHKFNRVTLVVGSGIGMSIMVGIAAVTLSIDSTGTYRWIPALCVFGYTFFCMLGMIDIPWMMQAEVFPSQMRATLCASISVVIFFLTFLNVKSYPLMMEYLSTAGIFYYFAVFSSLTALFAKLYFPETRGKPLTEIEDYFRK